MDNLPFTTTETAACQSMLHELQKGAKTMSRRQQQRDLLATAKSEARKLADLLAKHDGALSYTADVWSDVSMNEYLGITVHWCTRDFKLHSTLLNMQPLTADRTGDYLAVIFERSLRTFGLWPRVFHVTTDNGTDMLRMVCLLGLRIPDFDALQQGLRCICHTVNIAVKDMFGRMQCEGFEDEEAAAYALGIRPVVDDQSYVNWDGVQPLEIEHDIIDDPSPASEAELDDLEHLLRKVRTLVVAIRRSPKRKRALQAHYRIYPELRALKPQLDIQGRWNSIHFMFSRLLYMKLPLQHVCTDDPKLGRYWPTDREWALIAKFTRVLKAYKDATEVLSAEKRITVEWVIPIMDALMGAVEDFRKEDWGDEAMKQALHLGWEALQGYYSQMKQPVYYVGLFLNPRVKNEYIHQHWPDEMAETTATIDRIWQHYQDRDVPHQDPRRDTMPGPSHHPGQPAGNPFAHLLGSDLADEEELPPVEDDLTRYRRDPRIALSAWKSVYHEDPLSWWAEEGQKHYPRLAIMARDYFAIQGTETIMAPS
jgi:hypothetical protein